MKHCFCNYKPVDDDSFGEFYNGRGWYYCCVCDKPETKEERKGNEHRHGIKTTCIKEE